MTFRAGDAIHHAPSGEDWVLAVDEERGEVICAGWPETLARAADCTLIEAASDRARIEMLTRVADACSDQVRGGRAARQLGAMPSVRMNLDADELDAELLQHAEGGQR